jgi:CheY-like chemotaxis protein
MPRPLIAIIDGDAAFRRLMQDFLEGEGYRTRAWGRCATALPQVRGAPPALVLLDLYLERDGAGWDCLTGLRSDPATAGIPVIVCSVHTAALTEHQAALARLGVAALAKPFDLDHLLALLATCLAAPPAQRAAARRRHFNPYPLKESP